MSVLNYTCPNCSAGLTFDGKTQKMVCEFCGSSFEVEELEERQRQEAENSSHWEEFQPGQWEDGGQDGMYVWNCSSCGAQIIAEETEGARKCPYCDTPMIRPEQFSGMYLPDYILPFRKTKKDALDALKKHYLGKPLLPKVFKDQNHLEEIQAMYVPFWLFDLQAEGTFRYEGIRTRVFNRGEYCYTENSIYDVIRRGTMDFSGVPADGSKKIDDTMMEAIEPYDYQDLKPFQLSYLSGYLANKYDVEPDDLTERIHERIGQSMAHSMRKTVFGYEQVVPKSRRVRITKKGRVSYCLLPVWFLNTRWNGKTYTFVMNGQTGKLTGDLPAGRDMMALYWFKWHLPLTAAGTALMMLLRLMGVI